MKKKNFFNIKKNIIEIYNFELFFVEHSEEIRQRLAQCFLLILTTTLFSFVNINSIVKFLQKPVSSLKFFQLSPGEFFISTIEISLFFGLLISSPLIINQLIFFLLPGLNEKEKLFIPFLIISSVILFFISLTFSYFILIPVTLGFFISYSKDSIEPLLSYNQYITFISALFFGAGILFQIPIIQILLSLLNIISGKKMLENWRYIIVIATVVSAIFTPSADPLTQILFAGVLILLYLTGAFISIFLKSI